MRQTYQLIFVAILFVSCNQSTHKSEVSINQIRPYKPADINLYNQIMAMDKEFFEAYNNCDLEKQSFIYSDNIEFFHDQGGLITSKEEIIEGTKKFICGKVTRTLIEESVEVYPIKNYGAVEIGFHSFYNNQELDAPSTPTKFIIMWQKDNEGWKITKVISLH